MSYYDAGPSYDAGLYVDESAVGADYGADYGADDGVYGRVSEQPSQQPPPPSPPEVNARDWHGEFLALDASDRHEELAAFVADFTAEAERVGVEIITERARAGGRKYQPLDAGGVAGGIKYCVNGVFYKLAVDEHGLYGGDQVAGKVASREVLSSNVIIGAKMRLRLSTDVQLPLSCCICYAGVTLLASSLLPIDKTTLVYGSCDAGQTVHNDDPALDRALLELAAELKLKPHLCRDKTLVFGTDVEGHRGRDGRYYLLDASRVFPSEPVTKSSPKGAFLYRLLRPELLARSPVKLSADAFSRFALADPEWKTHNNEVRSVYAMLCDVFVPAFLERCRARPVPDDATVFVAVAHSFGLNVRTLGLLHQLCGAADVELAAFLSGELTARAAKNVVRTWVAAHGGDDVAAVHRDCIARLWGPQSSDADWAAVCSAAEAAFAPFSLSPAAVQTARASDSIRLRALALLGVDPVDGSVKAKTKQLYCFAYRAAEGFFRSTMHLVDGASLQLLRERLSQYREMLARFSASPWLWNDLGLAAVGIVVR